MAEEKKAPLKIEFGMVNEKNLGQFKQINLETLPTKYSDHFYQLILFSPKYTRLAYYNDLVIGSISCKYEKENNIEHMYIMTIGVLPPYRRLGVAVQLFKKSIEEFMKPNNLHVCRLHVQESNVAAVNFYKKMGFAQLERLENFYQQPTVVPPHALKMELKVEF
jgi:ribosomal protein S18 acetylase RimI-like enzyme